jgi:superfamily I DNA/RNA helicase
MPRIYKIIGPPGTGKTEYLMRQVEKACNKYFSKEIGYVSFTVASVAEAKDRIKKKLDVDWKDIPNVRTIHSHCFNLLGTKKEDVMETAKNIREFNENYPAFQISGGKNDEDMKEFEGNDGLFNQVQIFRSQLIPADQWPGECQSFYRAWTEHMENEGKIDFSGMLEQCLDRELSPDIKVLMVDETQDLPALQIALIKQWGEQCDSVLYAGDSNQAIFRFAGSDPNNFINLKADKVIPLTQSYRLSPAILAKSLEIIRQANIKELVDFKSTDKYGPGQVLAIRHPDLSLPGTHMILCRCNYQLKPYIAALRKANVPFCNQYRKEEKKWNPLGLDGAESIRVYLRLRRGESLDIYEIKRMVKNCVAKTCMVRGAKKKIEGLPLTEKKKYEFFGLLGMGFLGSFLDGKGSVEEYFRLKSENADLVYHLANDEPEQFFETPKVCVGTFHSTKGAEASHVWLDTGITTRIKKAIDSDPDAWDDECRVAYVACTRARKTLGLIRGRGFQNPFLQI